MEIFGYASLFDVRDLAGDMVAKGSFEQSLQQIPAQGVRMLYQHDQSRPIGKWLEIREDSIGLFVRGVINSDIADGRLAKAMITDHAMDGLSIGFRTLEQKSVDPDASIADSLLTKRIITKIDLREVSIVGFPMLPRARLRFKNNSE